MKAEKNWRREYFSVPNLLGYLRILLALFYLLICIWAKDSSDYHLAAIVIAVSMLSDFLDGKIARRYGLITDWGKILDPIADKITLGVVAFSFMLRYPLADVVTGIFLVKETFMLAVGIYLMKKGWRSEGALFCGKVCTAVMYLISVFLLLVPDVMPAAANLLLLLEALLMLGTLACYVWLYGIAIYRIGSGIPADQLSLKQIQKEQKQKHAKWKKWIAPAVLLFVIYLVAGAVLPFTKQPEVSKETVQAFDPQQCYGTADSTERARIISDNGEALDMRIQMIQHAKKRVILSTFDFRTDDAGLDLLAALLDAAERGVSVELFADGFNSWLRMEGNPYFYALSGMPGVKVTIYNKVCLLQPWTIMGRMHDKYVIVDDTAYVLGGRNSFGYFLGDYEGHKNYDWDVLVYEEQEKSTAEDQSSLAQLLRYYETITAQDCCTSFHNSASVRKKWSVRRAANELHQRLDALKEQKPELFEQPYEYGDKTEPTEKISLLSNPVHIFAKEPVVFYELMKLSENAEEVRIHTPYIVCNDKMTEAFEKLGDRVTVMTNSVANNGNPFASVDYLMNKQNLIDTGMQILEYEGGVSYHGKVMTMDDRLSLVGSFNMDMRSTYIDTELMVVIDSKEVNQTLSKEMKRYEEKAALVDTVSTYREVPAGMTMQPVAAIRLWMRDGLGWLLEGLRFLL